MSTLTAPDEYYLLVNEEQTGPYNLERLRLLYRTGQITRQTLFWQEGLAEWLTLSALEDLLFPAVKNSFAMKSAPKPRSDCSRGTYIILALFLGCLGIHNFYAGRHKNGAAQLCITILLCWTVVAPIGVALWAILDMVLVVEDGEGREFRMSGGARESGDLSALWLAVLILVVAGTAVFLLARIRSANREMQEIYNSRPSF